MDGPSKEEEEDSTFTNISLTDDIGKEELDEFWNLKFSNCSAFRKYNLLFYYNGKTLLIIENLKIIATKWNKKYLFKSYFSFPFKLSDYLESFCGCILPSFKINQQTKIQTVYFLKAQELSPQSCD